MTATEDGSTAITGVSVSDIDANPASDTIEVVLSVNNGTLTLLTNVTNGLGSTDIAGNGSGTVTLTGPQNKINTTLAAVNGLRYQGASNINGNDTLTIITNDQGHTGTPGALQTPNTVTITISPGNDAPDLTPNSPTAVSYVTGSAAVGLLATGAVTDVDGPANFAGGSYPSPSTPASGPATRSCCSRLPALRPARGEGQRQQYGRHHPRARHRHDRRALPRHDPDRSQRPGRGVRIEPTAPASLAEADLRDSGNVGSGPGTDTVTQVVHVIAANVAGADLEHHRHHASRSRSRPLAPASIDHQATAPSATVQIRGYVWRFLNFATPPRSIAFNSATGADPHQDHRSDARRGDFGTRCAASPTPTPATADHDPRSISFTVQDRTAPPMAATTPP